MTPEQHFLAQFQTVLHVWIEVHDGDEDARDVIVQMEGGSMYTALFVTLSYLHRQMNLSYELTQMVEGTIPVRFATLDTPHLLVEKLDRDTIEDIIDNLVAMETFESLFTRVTETPDDDMSTTGGSGRRATQEVAAVVLEEVLVVDEAEAE